MTWKHKYREAERGLRSSTWGRPPTRGAVGSKPPACHAHRQPRGPAAPLFHGAGSGGVVCVDQLHVLWFSSFESSAGSGDCALFPGSTAPTRGVSPVPRRSQVLRSRASRGHRIVGGDSPRSRQPHPLPGPGGSACSLGQKHEALSPSSNQGNDPESGCCRVCASLRGPAPGM